MCKVTYHSAYSSRFLYTESLDHLEHIHHSLCLTPLNGGGYGTEHPRPAHCITAHNTPSIAVKEGIIIDTNTCAYIAH